MTWTADRTAVLNIGRALASPQGRAILKDFNAEGLPLVPAGASDRLGNIAAQFQDGAAVIAYARDQYVIDFIKLLPGANYDLSIVPNTPMESFVQDLDRAESRWLSRPVEHQQLILA